MVLGWVLGHVRFERDARPLEEDHPVGPVVLGRVAVVRVVDAGEILGDAHRVPAGGDVFEHAAVPHALLALSVGAVVIEVAKLANQRALADSGASDDGDTHQISTLTTLVTSSTVVSPSASSQAA